VIYRKTLGNCFFVRQFLEMLQDQGSLSYSFQSYKWVWQIDDINARTNISTNVVDLVMGRITMLDVTTQQIFKVLGCLGSQCPVHVLHLLSSTLVKANMDPVDETVTRQIVDKLISMNLVEACKNDWIKFSHDRVQQAAEMWMANDEHEKLWYRLEIGRFLKQYLQSSAAVPDKDWLFFTTIDQLNMGSTLIADSNERSELLQLDRQAAEKAQQRSAFLPAAGYFMAAVALMDENVWLTDPATALEVRVAAATCYIRCGRSDKAFRLLREVLEHVSNPADQLKIKTLQIEALAQQRLFEEGKSVGIAILKSIGERFPKKPNSFHVIRGFLRTKRLLKKYTDDQLLNLPTMTDKRQFTISQLIHTVDRLLFCAKEKSIVPLLWFRTIEKFLTFGSSSYACAALTMFAALLGHMEDIEMATRISSVALELAETVDDKEGLPMTYTINYCFSTHWRKPLQTSINPLFNTYIMWQ
jgi:predicted ATPase